MDYQAIRKKLVGPMELVPTVFDRQGRLDAEASADVIDFMVDRGIGREVGFLLVGGATSQFTTLTQEERKQLHEACVRRAAGRVPVVVSAQTTGTDLSIDLARHAAGCGADAIQLSPPHYYFHPQLSQDDVVRFFADVAGAAGIAVVGYHNWWSSVGIAPATLVRLAEELPAFVGVKWRGRDDYENYLGYRLCAEKIAMVENSLHLQLTAPHQMGARAFISYVGIAWPEWDLELWEQLEAKRYAEAAEKLLGLAVPLYALCNEVSGEHSNIMAELMRIAGLPTWTPRRPTPPLPSGATRKLQEMFERAGAPFPVGAAR